jgi:hypothetical protein
MREQRVSLRLASGVEEAAETARVVEAQCDARIQQQVEMIMSETRGAARHCAQVARHAEVQQQCPGLESEQQVLCAPVNAHDSLPRNLARQIARHAPAQPRLVYREPGDAAATHVRREAAPRRLDFGKFGQGYLIFDSL